MTISTSASSGSRRGWCIPSGAPPAETSRLLTSHRGPRCATRISKQKTVPQPTQPVSPEELGVERELVTLSWDGNTHEVKGRRAVIGRSRDCDVQLADANVSRRHAELRQEGASYWIVDLGSTNGIEVDGKRVKRAKLRSGDTVTLGSTDVAFARESE